MQDKHRRSLRHKNKDRITDVAHFVGVTPEETDTRADLAHRISRSVEATEMVDCIGVPKLLYISYHVLRKAPDSERVSRKDIEAILSPEQLRNLKKETIRKLAKNTHTHQKLKSGSVVDNTR